VAVGSLVLLFSVLCHPSSVRAAEGATTGDTMAAPLSKTIGRLAEQPSLGAKDCAEMAQSTLTYADRLKSAQQKPTESVVRDALQAVDLGEQTDAKAADWPKLRSDLEALLKREDEEKKKDEQKQDKKQDQQNKDQQQNQDQKQDKQSQDQKQNDQQKQDQPQQQKQPDQQQKENQDAFGDMKDKKDKEKKSDQKPPQPRAGTQKVGGQQEKKQVEQVDPDLAMPLQKLDQVRNQDSPAKLQQLMQGPQQKTKGNGKDW